MIKIKLMENYHLLLNVVIILLTLVTNVIMSSISSAQSTPELSEMSGATVTQEETNSLISSRDLTAILGKSHEV